MFSSAQEFEDAMKMALRNIENGKLKQFYETNSEQDNIDVLQKLLDLGYATGYSLSGSLGGYMLSLNNPRITIEGLRFLEGKHQEPLIQPIQNFHINQASNSMFGIQNQSTINVTYSDEQIRDLIDSQCDNEEDRKELHALLETLNAVIQNNIPVQKGTFARFSDLISKYSWITSPIVGRLLEHFTK
ncbi:hypothetical protein NDK47_24320 [Brevibacillus ruminantium]|uniref:Uncharacterized protein n=1 Tax=Brevibacillus ruminantium TaxID=2950604 RepID=A0ABY4WDS0_9BACL|nr:hypothetical protein [Brevibacillus ruminantium]USG65212.1 hypothetical protein NDK47_24320 [Brevibacillus ruminantium]